MLSGLETGTFTGRTILLDKIDLLSVLREHNHSELYVYAHSMLQRQSGGPAKTEIDILSYSLFFKKSCSVSCLPKTVHSYL